MLHALNALLAPALMERLALVVNHVVAGEPAAVERLRPHAGRLLQLELAGWPSLLPAPPLLAFRVTPAGLVEWCADLGGATADLLATVDASNPAMLALRAMGGERPSVDIRGDSQLATDVDWLLKNLRWDVAADLERMFGPVVAQQLHKLGSVLSQGLRTALERAGGLAGRFGARGGFEGRSGPGR